MSKACNWVTLLATCGLSLLAIAVQSGEPSEELVQLFNEARRAVLNGKSEEAIPKLEKVVAAAPDEPYPAYLLARAFLMKKEDDKALRYFLQATERGLLSSYEPLLEIEADPLMAPVRNWPQYQKIAAEKVDFGMAQDLVAQDLDGKTVRLSDLRGKPVLLVFWSITCGVCHVEFSDLQKAYEELTKKGLVVVAAAPEGPEQQKEHIAQGGWKFTFWRYDPSKRMLPLLYAVTSRATPANFFIDREGRIARYYPGYVKSGDFSYAIDLVTKAPEKQP